MHNASAKIISRVVHRMNITGLLAFLLKLLPFFTLLLL